MPVEAKPLFRPDVLHSHLAGYALPAVDSTRLNHWAHLIATGRINTFGEQEILRDFLNDYFVGLLGYTRPAGNDRYTIGWERHIEVDGKYADAVLGDFNGEQRYVVALEGKGPRDPLDRPYAGRRMSAVDQGYRYAINLPCDWIIVTSIRQTRLYYKGSDQLTYERFDTEQLADDETALRRFLFLLGSERVVPQTGECHFYRLRAESEQVGRELTKQFYVNYANMRQDAFEVLSRDNPSVSRHAVLASTQKLLDRVLFVAFSEDRGLLPTESIRKAYDHSDPYHARPIWENFRGLFSAINRGNAALRIHAYNGGLFADDAVLDSLAVSDEVCGYFRELGNYDYQPAHSATGEGRVIDVDILGHIFEQSITDLERLRNELDGLAEPLGAERHKTRRKKEGAFYTPSFITRYIVEQALGGVLDDRFEELRQRQQKSAKGVAKAALANPRVYELSALTKPAKTALVKFWEAWQQDELRTIRILDPACGSGAFLIEAFDRLHAAYVHSNERLLELRGHRSIFDLDKRILEKNIYGVDLNEEAIEICRLSLWIKTAAPGKALTSLDHPIRVGNSVVSDPAVHRLATDWQVCFPEVFAQGGFDVVVGNPPYIRQELLTAYKPHWQERFASVYAGTADIYAYFYALGSELLRPKGRLAFISSSGFARAGFGENLRRFLASQTRFEQFIDLGDTQVFSDAKDVYPAIVVLSKPAPEARSSPSSVRTIRLRRSDDPVQISELVATSAWNVPISQLSPDGWQFEEPRIVALRQKLHTTHTSLSYFVGGRFFRGLITGLNEAFVVEFGEEGCLCCG